MTPQEIVEALRRLCRDIDEGRSPQPISLGRAVGTWAIPVAIGLSGGAVGCGSNETTAPSPEPQPAPAATTDADRVPGPPEPANAEGATQDAGTGGDAAPVSSPPNDGGADAAVPPPRGDSKAKSPTSDRTVAKLLTGRADGKLLGQFSSITYGAPFHRGEPVARVRLHSPSVKGGLGREVVRRHARRTLGKLRSCYLERLESHPKLKGRLLLRYEINPAGKVTSAVIKSSSLQDKTVEFCVLQFIKSHRFPENDAREPTTVEAQLELAPPPPAKASSLELRQR